MVFNSPCYLYEELASPKANSSWANDNCDSPLLGVNIPRSDDDRLKLMELMVLLLQKGVCVHIGITAARISSYCCQANFWNTAFVKRSGDVTRLQALVDKKKIVISEAVICKILQLNDARGVVYLPNEEIFAGLAQMGYEKPSTKLTFYKAFFSSQWKFLIHTILQSLSTKRTSWNEFSTTMASVVICLSKGQRLNFLKYIFDSLVRNVDNSSKFYMYPRFIQLIIQNQVGDLSTHTTRFISLDLTQKVFDNMRRVRKEPSSPPQQQQSSPQAPPQDAEFLTQLQQVLNICSALSKRVENLENDNTTQKLEIVKLKARVKKLEKANKIKSSKLRRLRKVGTSRIVESSADMEDVFNQGRMIDDMDMDEEIELVKNAKVAESEGRHATQQVEKQAEIYNLDLDHSLKVLISAASTTIPVASAIIPTAKLTIPAATPTVVAAYTKRRKGVIITDSKEELPLKTPAETPKVKDKGKGILVETPKPMKKKDQIEMDAKYARKLQEEIDRDHDGFNKDIDWDAAMDHVNQKSNNPQYIKRYQGMKKRPQTESEAQKNMMIYLKNTAGYKMDFFKGMNYAQICPIFQARFDENMRKHLEVVEDEDDDVFVEATPLAQKDAIWRNQKSVYGLALVKRWKLLTSCGVHVITLSTVQLFLLVERRYPLSRFTLEQLVNVTRLQVEEESKMSLELLRFTRQQLQEYQQR
nr:hypothetical protein [Tanacetum cinerariifolium]